MPRLPPPRSIVITGGSSGLGRALALAYAAPGIHLFLSGRDADRLGQSVAECQAKGALCHGTVLDVTDAIAMAQWLEKIDTETPIDLLIANAGISGNDPSVSDLSDDDRTRALFDVNLYGVMNSVLPVIPLMRNRGQGQIALMSSLAGSMGFPSAPAYCAAKAAVRVWGQGLRGKLSDDGICVSVICPGFVRSRLTDRNRFPMPFLMETDKAAQRIKKGLAVNQPQVRFPWAISFVTDLLCVLPYHLTDWLNTHLPRKE